VLASVRKMYALSVVKKAKHIHGERKEKDASYDRCQEAEQARSRLVLGIRGGMTCSNDMNSREKNVPQRHSSKEDGEHVS